MNVISSRQTFFAKRIFPAIWLGGVALVLILGVTANVSHASSPGNIVFLLVPALMLVFGFLLFRKLLWDLADEVQDGGDYLLVRKGAIEKRIPLADILNVSMSQFTNPKRVTLRLRSPCELGDEIAFIPKMPVFRLNPFARNAVAEDLMRRVDQARRGAFA
ncbi:MAG: hypothetical protein OJF55_000987 [Rhodanobacteraceae bacterium]|nr:MAG: hypothetical protein OJF55_000987 [Rhodanobacteraceae bacterium]